MWEEKRRPEEKQGGEHRNLEGGQGGEFGLGGGGGGGGVRLIGGLVQFKRGSFSSKRNFQRGWKEKRCFLA